MDIREIAEFWNSSGTASMKVSTQKQKMARFMPPERRQNWQMSALARKTVRAFFKAHILDVKGEPFSKTNGSSYQLTAINDGGSIILSSITKMTIPACPARKRSSSSILEKRTR